MSLSEKLVGSTSNDDLLVTVSLGERGLLAPYNIYVLEITNLSDETIKIIWDDCLIIDRYKQMTRMIMGDTHLSEANKEQMPTLILPNSSLIEPVVSVSHIIDHESIYKIDGAIGEITFYLTYLKGQEEKDFHGTVYNQNQSSWFDENKNTVFITVGVGVAVIAGFAFFLYANNNFDALM